MWTIRRTTKTREGETTSEETANSLGAATFKLWRELRSHLIMDYVRFAREVNRNIEERGLCTIVAGDRTYILKETK